MRAKQSALYVLINLLKARKQQVNQQDGGGDLPGIFEVIRIGDLKATGGVADDGDLMVLEGGKQVEHPVGLKSEKPISISYTDLGNPSRLVDH